MADLLVVEGGARPDIHMLAVDEPLPMAGHLAMQSMPAIYEPHPPAQDDARLRQHAHAGRGRVPGALGPQRRRARRSRSTTARSTSRSGAASRRRWARAGSRRWCAPRRSTSASTGATSISSSTSARRRAPSRIMQRIGRSNHRMDEPSKAYPRAGEPLRDPRMPRRARRRARGGAGHAGCPPRRAGRALPAHPRHGLRRAVRRGRALRRGALGGALRLDVARGFRRRSSPSSRPAATRCAPTSASPRSGKVPTGSGGCATAASRSNTGSTSAPSSRRR